MRTIHVSQTFQSVPLWILKRPISTQKRVDWNTKKSHTRRRWGRYTCHKHSSVTQFEYKRDPFQHKRELIEIQQRYIHDIRAIDVSKRFQNLLLFTYTRIQYKYKRDPLRYKRDPPRYNTDPYTTWGQWISCIYSIESRNYVCLCTKETHLDITQNHVRHEDNECHASSI